MHEAWVDPASDIRGLQGSRVTKYIFLKSRMLFQIADITGIYEDTMLWSETMPKYLDLFAGAGGLSEGFIRAGYEPVAHVEMDAAACYSLKTRVAYHWLKKQNKLELYERYLNQEITRERFYQYIPENVLNTVLNYEISDDNLEKIFCDIDGFLEGKNLDLIVGGPPCQAYSIAGRSRSENRMVGDKRNYLYKLYAEFLKKYKPEYFVERDLSRVFFTKTFAVIYEFIFFNFLIKDRQTSVNLNFHVIKENLKRSKLKLV